MSPTTTWYNKPRTVKITGFLDFVHHPVFYKLENTAYRKQAQWLRSSVSKGPNRVGVSPLTWDGKQIQFPKRCVL
jgi:hypothetical protein